jgi:hypothetical protein
MSEQQNQVAITPPTTRNREEWKAYWRAQGYTYLDPSLGEIAWRTEPEIDDKRKQFLTERRDAGFDIGQRAYPFKDI